MDRKSISRKDEGHSCIESCSFHVYRQAEETERRSTIEGHSAAHRAESIKYVEAESTDFPLFWT